MFGIIESGQQYFNDGLGEFIDAIAVIFITIDDGRKGLDAGSFFDEIVGFDVFLFEEVDDFIDLIVIFFVGIASDDDFELFACRVSFLLVSEI